MRKRLWHLVQILAGLAIVFFVARYVVLNWDQVREADLAWRLSPLHLLGGIGLIWLVLALQGGPAGGTKSQPASGNPRHRRRLGPRRRWLVRRQ